MKNHCVYAVSLLVWLSGCHPDKPKSTKIWKDEILSTEKAFAEMASREGINKAFEAYAASEAVLKRNDQLIEGKAAIVSWLAVHRPDPSATLIWTPDYVDVSESGDLGYTYGEFVFSQTDSLGNVHEINGVFHTVWKRQVDGTWKYVWD